MKWVQKPHSRLFVDDKGWTFIAITNETPQATFEAVQRECEKHRTAIASIMQAMHEEMATRVGPLRHAPKWAVDKDRLMNQICRTAGVVDS